jgi:hypothetical protein
MDQLEYYISTNNFQEIINHSNLQNVIVKETNHSSENNELKKQISDMEAHIYNLHICIFNEISKKGLKKKFIKQLKHEINNYEYNKLLNN